MSKKRKKAGRDRKMEISGAIAALVLLAVAMLILSSCGTSDKRKQMHLPHLL